MNKGELIDKLAEKTGLSKGDAKKAFDGLLTVIGETTAAGEKINITGFATIEKVHKPASTGRNPGTGAAVDIAARDTLKVKISKSFEAEIFKAA